jgi:hypothetical protein
MSMDRFVVGVQLRRVDWQDRRAPLHFEADAVDEGAAGVS